MLLILHWHLIGVKCCARVIWEHVSVLLEEAIFLWWWRKKTGEYYWLVELVLSWKGPYWFRLSVLFDNSISFNDWGNSMHAREWWNRWGYWSVWHTTTKWKLSASSSFSSMQVEQVVMLWINHWSFFTTLIFANCHVANFRGGRTAGHVHIFLWDHDITGNLCSNCIISIAKSLWWEPLLFSKVSLLKLAMNNKDLFLIC